MDETDGDEGTRRLSSLDAESFQACPWAAHSLLKGLNLTRLIGTLLLA